MWSKSFVYVAGFDRGVRPIGDWSMSITLSKHSMPSTESCSPGFTRTRCRRFASALKTVSFTSVDLPEPETPGDRDELADRELDVDVLQVVLGGAAHPERAEVLGAAIRHRDRPLPRQELPGDRLRVLLNLGSGALGDDVPAVLAGARAHVDQVVGRAHHLLVVLDHEHGVAEVAQPLERRDQLRVVPLVEPDRRLVEDVEHADELRADLRREPQPLRLAAGQRRGRAVELEIPDADVVEERQPLADLLDDPRADQLLRLGQLERVEELDRAGDRHLRELVDVPLADGDREHLGLQARAAALRAGTEAHVLLDPLPLL